MVLSTDGRRAFVAQYAGEYVDGQYVPGAVAVVDLAKREVTARIPVRARPFAMARSADGRSVYVTHYFRIGGKGIVTKIDTGTLTVLGEIELAEDGDVSGGRGGVFNALASAGAPGARSRHACQRPPRRPPLPSDAQVTPFGVNRRNLTGLHAGHTVVIISVSHCEMEFYE